MKRAWMSMLAAVSLLLFVGLGASALTADEILDEIDAAEDRLVEGGLLATVRIENTHSDGTTSGYTVYGISLPDRRLMYFAEPPLDEGITYLFVDEKVDGETDTRFWLYLPVFGLVKELVSEEDLGGGFAGSSLSLSDVGGEATRADYETVILREETVAVADDVRTAYVLEMTRKPDADRDDALVMMWVDMDSYTTLKVEAYSDSGNLRSQMQVLALAEIDGQETWGTLESIDDAGNRSTFTYVERRRPEGAFPEELFTADGLGSFVPEAWGF